MIYTLENTINAGKPVEQESGSRMVRVHMRLEKESRCQFIFRRGLLGPGYNSHLVIGFRLSRLHIWLYFQKPLRKRAGAEW